MSATRLHSFSEAETRRLGERLGAVAAPGDVVLLNGRLGCGKTRFAQGAARGLGIARPVTSPTFALLNVYDEGRLPLYHFDLYRLESEEDLDDIDFYATVEGQGLALVEWAELFPDAMPEDCLTLTLKQDQVVAGEDAPSDATPLLLDAVACGARAESLLARWEAAL